VRQVHQDAGALGSSPPVYRQPPVLHAAITDALGQRPDRPVVSPLVRLFCQAYLLSVLQSAGVVLLAAHSPYALATAFAISWTWINATRSSVDHRVPHSRACYALGGMCGTATTLLVAWWCA
jgi:hypothetical protein